MAEAIRKTGTRQALTDRTERPDNAATAIVRAVGSYITAAAELSEERVVQSFPAQRALHRAIAHVFLHERMCCVIGSSHHAIVRVILQKTICILLRGRLV